jgi:hypothetical protein
MRNVGYEQHSLKAQLAIINRCFSLISETIEDLKTKALSDTAFRMDDKVLDALNSRLDDLYATTNSFQCYGRQRQEFYNSQIGSSAIDGVEAFYLYALQSIFGHQYVVSYVRAQRKPAALEHFNSSDARCDPQQAAIRSLS